MKDSLATLEALGFTLPSTAYLIGVVIFGIVGYVAYRYGRKMSFPATKWIGIGLMQLPVCHFRNLAAIRRGCRTVRRGVLVGAAVSELHSGNRPRRDLSGR